MTDTEQTDDWLDVMAGSEPGRERARQSLLTIAEEISNSGSFAWRPDHDQLVWSANLRRLWQVEAEPVAPLRTLLDRVHPDDLARVRGWVQWVRSGHLPPAIHFRIRLPRGGVRFMEVRVARRTDEDGSVFFVGWVQDVSDSHQAQREIACHLAVARALSELDSSGVVGTDGILRLIESLARGLGLSRARLWVRDRDGALQPRFVWDAPDETPRQLVGPVLALARSCVEVAWRTREPLWMGGITDEPGIPGDDPALWEASRNGVLVPITRGGEVLAVAGLPGVEELEITNRLMATLAGIGSEIGAFLSAHAGVLKPSVLSPRELEILRLASEGLSGPAIAKRLYVSPATVKTHFENIYVKYEVSDRVAAVAKAIREGILS